MRFSTDRLADHLGGELIGDPVEVDGVSIDSRSLRPGQLFAAVTDERDGHEFVAAAREAGAPAALVSRDVDGGPGVCVPAVPRALMVLAGVARRRLPEFVVGVTGSVGKTTTKDMLAGVLAQRFATAASERSFNNELGVPITLANAPEGTEATVVEMGARGHGHISLLCSLALPTVGVVTAVHAVHTEHMGGEDQIAVAKRELVEQLPPSGLAVLNAGDPRVAAMADHTRAEVLTFGDGGSVWASDVTVDDELRPRFTLESPWGSSAVAMQARGAHNVANALAAAAVGLWAGLSPESVAEGLAKPLASPWRMELTHAPDGLVVLNDAYNAGPASMAAALQSLAAVPAKRRVAVLGLMAELGDREAEEHRRIAELADALGVEVVAVGTELYGVPDMGSEEAVQTVRVLVDGEVRRSAVLVKGSRVAGLEVVVDGLLEQG